MVKLYHVGSIDMFNVILYNDDVLCSQMLKHTQTHIIFVDFVKCNKNTFIAKCAQGDSSLFGLMDAHRSHTHYIVILSP